MKDEILYRHETTLVRRLIPAPAKPRIAIRKSASGCRLGLGEMRLKLNFSMAQLSSELRLLLARSMGYPVRAYPPRCQCRSGAL